MNLHTPAPEAPRAGRPERPLRLVASLLVLAGMVAAMAEGCASETPKAGIGEKCEDSAQCDRTKELVCRCIRRKSADEEGPEQILAPGVCQAADYKCPPADAGPPPEGGTDTGAAETTGDAGDAATDGAKDAVDDVPPSETAPDGGGDGAAEAADTGDG